MKIVLKFLFCDSEFQKIYQQEKNYILVFIQTYINSHSKLETDWVIHLKKKLFLGVSEKMQGYLNHKFLSQTKILHLSPPNSHTHCFIQTHTTINHTQCRNWDLNSKLKYHLLEPKITIKQCNQIMTLREICSWITTPSRY